MTAFVLPSRTDFDPASFFPAFILLGFGRGSESALKLGCCGRIPWTGRAIAIIRSVRRPNVV